MHNKKIVISLSSILILIAISFIGFKIFATDSSEETITIKFDLNGGSFGVLCKRATKLHEETCSQSDESSYCSGSGITTGSTITYGNINESTKLVSGDAFDCDVDGNGIYDEENERFYYVTDMDNDTAVLIYSNNVSDGKIDNVNSHVYNSVSSEINYGPIAAKEHLPLTTQWRNTSLKNQVREIKDENSVTKLRFDYSNHVARLLTYEELYDACYDGTTELTERGAIKTKCSYMLENTEYATAGLSTGFWLESAVSVASSNGARAWNVGARYKDLGYSLTFLTNYGIRPVIEVPKTKISLSNDEKYDNIITLKKENIIDLNDYAPEWNNKVKNSFADLSWTCKNQTNNSSVPITSSEFNTSTYAQCIDSNGNIEISANWDEYHIVMLNGVGGTIDGETAVTFKSYPSKNTYNLGNYKAENEGYKLLGYGIYSNSLYEPLAVTGSEYKTFSTGYPDIESYISNGYLDLYAVWDKEYKISYNAMGGNDGPSKEKYGESEELTIPSQTPIREGYKFKGWSLSPSGGSTIYKSRDKISMSQLIQNSNSSTSEIYFYAIWEESYAVVYNANGGENVPSYHRFFVSEDLIISSEVPTRYGYNFKGWSYTKDGIVALNPGDTISGTEVSQYFVNKTLDLYAIWERIYTINYIDGAELFEKENYTSNDSYKIPIQFPSRINHRFQGWSFSENGSVDFTPGNTGNFSDLVNKADSNGNINLYAVWERAYKIKIKVEDDIRDYGTYYNSEEFVVPTNSVTKENYEFIGWSLTSSETNIIEANTKLNVSKINSYADNDGVITLYAIYKKNYIIKFNANGGENAPGDLSNALEFVIPNTIPKKEGYSFAGWQIDISSNKVYIPTDTVTISDISNEFKNDYTITLYAKWSEKYTIEYDANGGENAPQSIELSSLTGNLSTTIPTKEGYIFKGWAYQNNSENPVYLEGGLYDINNIPSEYISDKNIIKLYAVWGKQYTIKFDANGGENAPNNLDTLATGSLPESIPVKEGYKFKGWSLNKDGEIWRSSTGYYDLSDLKLENYELTLYAVWQKVSNSLKDVEIKITDEIIDEEIADIIIEEVFEDNEIFINIRNKANNRLNNKVTKLKVYNIYLVDSNNEKIQPTKDINLEISLPYGYTNNIIVYRMEDNNKLTKLISNINDNKISFTTSHFSYYSIVEVDNSENASLLDDESKENNNTITENQNVDNMSNSSNNNNKNNNNESIENPPTGIVISVITLTTLALIAVGIKYFVKKKTLFRKL